MIGRNTINTIPDALTVQWANGKTHGKRPDERRFTSFVGFHIEQGRDPEVDQLLASVGTSAVLLKHQRPAGSAEVLHWDLGEHVIIYPVTSGPVAPTVAAASQRYVQDTAEAGIGLRWPKGEGERSRLAVRGFLKLLTDAGCHRLVQLGVRSRMTDERYAALLDHIRVLEAADAIAGHDVLHTGHHIGWPLTGGVEKAFGKGDTSDVIPIRSGHREEVDAEYIKSLRSTPAIDQAALDVCQGLWPGQPRSRSRTRTPPSGRTAPSTPSWSQPSTTRTYSHEKGSPHARHNLHPHRRDHVCGGARGTTPV